MLDNTTQEFSHCPERGEYKKFINSDNSGLDTKEYTKTLKYLTENYKAAFHDYVADVYPHLRFEIGEEKVFWNYNEDEGIYNEVSHSTTKEWVMKLLIDEGLRTSAIEGFAKNVLSRYRACYAERGNVYEDFDNDSEWFHCANGWVNVTTRVFEAHTPERMSRRVSNVVFDPKASCPVYDKFLDKELELPKDQVRALNQYSGLLLTPNIHEQKMLAIIGSSGCGKSTLLNTWSSILGELSTSQALSDIHGDQFRFMGSTLVGRTLCWFDEVEPNRGKMGDRLIGLITQKQINIERKGINGNRTAPNQMKFVLTANSLPRSAEIGIYRRLILIYLNHSFTDDMTVDHQMDDKLEKEASGILNRMLDGLADLHKVGTFSVIEGQAELIEEYKTSSNTIAEFLEEHFEFDYDAEPIDSKKLLSAYKEFADDKYSNSLTPQRFGVIMGQHGLVKFKQITRKKGTHGVRQWIGLKVREPYEITSEGWLRIKDDF